MALAAEAHDEQRLVIDLKSESNSNSHQETDDVAVDESSKTAATLGHYDTSDTGDNGVSRVKRKRKSSRQKDTKQNSNLDDDIVEKVVQRVSIIHYLNTSASSELNRQ